MRHISVAWVFALTIFVLGAMTASPARAQSIPVPDNDPFYVPPAGYAALPNGTVLNSRTINAVYILPALSTDLLTQLGTYAAQFAPQFKELQNLKINAYQVLYKTTDSHNQPQATVTTILVPQGPWVGNGSRPLLSYQSAEDSVSNICAPSYVLRTGLLGQLGSQTSNSAFDTGMALLGLLYGYAVAIPDYEGPKSVWIDGPQAGHAVLDGIRAVLSYAPTGLSPNTQVALLGYSGGGGATGWGAQLRQSYAPELNIVGAAIGSPSNGDLSKMITNNNGTVTDGVLVLALAGLNRAYPEAGIQEYLNPAGQKLIASVANDCALTGFVRNAFSGPLENYTVAPNTPLIDSAPAKYLFGLNSLVDQATSPNTPVLAFADQWDELVPVGATVGMAQKFCKGGTQVEVSLTSTPLPFVALIHVAGAAEGTLPAYNYIANRFKGVKPRNDCTALAQMQWTNPFKLPYSPFVTQ